MIKLVDGVNNLLEKFVLFSVLLFPITIVLVKSGGSSIFGILVLLSLYVFFTQALKLNFTREEKLFFYSFLLFFLIAILISWGSGFDKEAWKADSRFLNLLFAVPLYFLFKNYLKNTAIIWWGLFLAVISCGAVAFYEINFGSLYGGFDGRAKAATHPILFADMSLAMMSMLLMAMTTLKKWDFKIIAAMILISSFGLSAVILSQSRGAWVILPVLALMFFWQFKKHISVKSFSITMLVMPLLAISIYLIPSTGLQQRVDSTFSNVQKYSQGTHKTTSVGTRFEMWKASWLIFEEMPFKGVGWGNYQETAKVLVEQGLVSKSAATWNNPHSQYFSVLANGGLVMLVALFILFLVPLKRFRNLLRINDSETRAYALAGISLIVAYMGFAFSESIFERTIPTAFFAFYIALFFAMANRTKEQKTIEGIKRTKKLSVVLVAYNEADRIEECLLSISGWADEIIIFDNGSTDGTIEIAKKYTDKVFVTDWPGYGKQKQRALDKAQYEWVLSLDADEKLTPELRSEIDYVLSSDNREVAYKIPIALILYDKRLDFGLYSRNHLRLFKREVARYTDVAVHERVIIKDGKIGLLQERFLHYSYRDLKHAVDKFNQNAWLWATERFEKGKKTTWLTAVINSIWLFFSGYFLKLGFLDGFRGLIMAAQAGMYTFNKYAILWALRLQEKK